MKEGTKILLAGAAVFAAVLGALQVNRMLVRRESADELFSAGPTVTTRPAAFEAGTVPADFTRPVQKIAPSVVSVDRLERTYDFFGDSQGIQKTGSGSGVVISADGYIVTNHHVVANADSVQVRTSDERSVEARVIGTDAKSDLAVLKIDGKGLVPADLGDSSKLKVGEWVIAVGNPLGYSNTVSVGVVSNLNRTLQTGRTTYVWDGIQTDAAINQGNSGGALTNVQGQLIGINSAIATNTGGSIGLGFAIPVNRVKRVANDIIKFGSVRYGELGVKLLEIERDFPGALSSPRLRRSLAGYAGSEPPTSGLVVLEVIPGSAAAEIGLQPGDVLTQINNNKLNLPVDYLKSLIDRRPGEKVRLNYWSKGANKSVDVTLREQ